MILPKFRKEIIYSLVVASLVVAIDQVTKFLITNKIYLHSKKVIISNFINLVHIKNKGIAFGIFNKPGTECYILSGITIIAIFFIIYMIFTEGKKSLFISIPLGLILGGAIGNLIDRILFGEVTDFIDLHIGIYHWPAFNVADMAISIGGFMILLFILMKKA